MDEQHFLIEAQEAEAIASAAVNRRERQHWENIAAEYRRLAKAVVAERRG